MKGYEKPEDQIGGEKASQRFDEEAFKDGIARGTDTQLWHPSGHRKAKKPEFSSLYYRRSFKTISNYLIFSQYYHNLIIFKLAQLNEL